MLTQNAFGALMRIYISSRLRHSALCYCFSSLHFAVTLHELQCVMRNAFTFSFVQAFAHSHLHENWGGRLFHEKCVFSFLFFRWLCCLRCVSHSNCIVCTVSNIRFKLEYFIVISFHHFSTTCWLWRVCFDFFPTFFLFFSITQLLCGTNYSFAINNFCYYCLKLPKSEHAQTIITL